MVSCFNSHFSVNEKKLIYFKCHDLDCCSFFFLNQFSQAKTKADGEIRRCQAKRHRIWISQCWQQRRCCNCLGRTEKKGKQIVSWCNLIWKKQTIVRWYLQNQVRRYCSIDPRTFNSWFIRFWYVFSWVRSHSSEGLNIFTGRVRKCNSGTSDWAKSGRSPGGWNSRNDGVRNGYKAPMLILVDGIPGKLLMLNCTQLRWIEYFSGRQGWEYRALRNKFCCASNELSVEALVFYRKC